MPGYDGRGPLGKGAGTGRGAGYCFVDCPNTFSFFRRRINFRNRGMRLGLGRGAGRGLCRWWAGYFGSYSRPSFRDIKTEKAYLEEQSAMLKSELADIEQQISVLDKQTE